MFRSAIALATRNRKSIFAILLALSISGCAAPVVKQEAVFFPAPPNPPRIQYLMGISSSGDIEEKNDKFSLLTGKEDSQNRAINKPYGITTHQGKIYVCDIGVGNVVVIDPVKKSFEYLKGNYNIGKLKKPANIAVDPDGNLYVADALRKEIVVYNVKGEYIRAFGKADDMKPADVAVDGESVYVLDINKKNNEIKIFDLKSGTVTGRLGKRTQEENQGLAMPTNFALDDKGFIYATNAGTGSVTKYDKDGHLLLSFGDFGDVVGKFSRPKGIAVDHLGRIYVVDGGNQNVQIFSDKGRILTFFGDPGLMRGSLNLPVGIAVTRDNLEFYQKMAEPGFALEAVIMVTNQFGRDKISVYGLGQMKGRENEAGPDRPIPGQDPKPKQSVQPEPGK